LKERRFVKEFDWQPCEQPAGNAQFSLGNSSNFDEKRRRTYDAYEAFLRGRLHGLCNRRHAQWHRDYSSMPAYEASIASMRVRLRRMVGFWVNPSERQPASRQNSEVILETEEFKAIRFDFEIMPNVSTYAVELIPHKSTLRRGLLLQHGYGGTPELICGLTENSNREDYSYRLLGLRAVKRGYHVLAVFHPYGYGSPADELFGLPQFPKMPGEYARNRLDRLAKMCGGTAFGLDLLASSRGIDLLLNSGNVDHNKIGMYGLSQGGQTALYLPAIDPRIRATVVSAYFNLRIHKLIGPCNSLSYLDSNEEDKFFTEVISTFSDSDVASLIAPRAMAVEAGLLDESVDFSQVQVEFEQARLHYDQLGIPDRIEFIAHQEGHVSATGRAFEFLEKQLS
jgi:cephalosporin-C deacetylase-like acetyl esterase